VTAYAVYLSAFAWLLHRKTRQRDICIESSTSMRTLHRDLAAVQGICVTWTILRLDVSAPTLRGVLAGAQRIVDEATENGIIADYYRRAPHTIRRAIFNYVPLPDRDDDPQHGALRVIPKRQPFPRWKRPWDLHLTMLDSARGTQLAWTGNAALFHRETLSSLLQEYLAILARDL
jgi:non-ribosomal peptide synthetase component F